MENILGSVKYSYCYNNFYVANFLRRFETIPDVREIDRLTVSGDVTYDGNVALKVSELPS